MRTTLEAFCDKHALPGDITDPLAVIMNAGHGNMVEAIADVYIRRGDTKKHVVWLYGPSGTGKTSVIELLGEIFCWAALEFKGQFQFMSERSQKCTGAQLVVCEEISKSSAFSKGNVADIKRLFEGKGCKCKNLHDKLAVHFVGVFVIVSSNGLPDISYPGHADYTDDWGALLTRMELVHMTRQHLARDRIAFPYSVAVLAHALLKIALAGDEDPACRFVLKTCDLQRPTPHLCDHATAIIEPAKESESMLVSEPNACRAEQPEDPMVQGLASANGALMTRNIGLRNDLKRVREDMAEMQTELNALKQDAEVSRKRDVKRDDKKAIKAAKGRALDAG